MENSPSSVNESELILLCVSEVAGLVLEAATSFEFISFALPFFNEKLRLMVFKVTDPLELFSAGFLLSAIL